MKRLLRFPIYVLILSGLLVSIIAKADCWDNPRVKTYYSENKEFKLIITPKMTSDKYYLWDYYRTMYKNKRDSDNFKGCSPLQNRNGLIRLSPK